ncbi:MAG: PAS domain S-box protein [Gammaproteobacteria bacterium]|nr:PAS domain S-box protein [Gammaproteobacteria bacterium]
MKSWTGCWTAGQNPSRHDPRRRRHGTAATVRDGREAPVTTGLESHLGLIYAVYGLAFFSLGVVVSVLPRSDNGLPFAPHLGWLAAFGMLHGLLEFVEGQRLLASAPWLDWAGGTLLILSYGALLEFGRRIWNIAEGPFRLPAALVQGAAVAGVAVFVLGAADPLAGLEAGSRWLAGTPGAVLVGAALLLFAGARARHAGADATIHWLRAAALALLAYGLLTPFLTTAYARLPAWLPTSGDFLDFTGLPVQLPRALCAVLAAVAFVMLVRRSGRRANTALRRVVNTLDGFVYRCRDDRHRSMTSVTDGVLGVTGYAPEAFLDPAEVHYGRLIHPDDVDDVRTGVQAATGARRDFDLSYRIVSRGGGVRWVHERGRGIRGLGDRLRYLEGHISDDTARQEAMEDLARTTRLLDSIVEHVPSMIFVKRAADLRFEYLNRAGETLLGRHREQVIGGTDRDLFPEEQAAFFTTKDREALESDGVVDIPEETIDARRGPRVFHTRKIAIRDDRGEPRYLLGISEDITESRRAALALQDSEARLREAQRIARVGNWELDLASGRLDWSEEIFRLFEIDPHRFAANYQAFLDAIHPADRERVDAACSRSLEDRTPYVISHRLRMGDGRIKWVEERCVTDFDGDGRPLVSRGTVQDITERHLLEEELRQFRATLDQTLDCVFMFAADTLRFTYVNRGAMDQLGYGREELLGMHPTDIKPAYDEARFRALIAPLLAGTRERLTFETVHRHRDGRDIPVEVFLQYINPPDQAPRFIAVVRDITERKQAEETLREMNRVLEQRVAERTAALAEREAQLRRAHAIARLGHWTTDVQSGEVTWSDEVYRIFGQDPETFRPGVEAFYATVHPDDLEPVQEAADATLSGTGDFRIDHRIVLPGGEVRWVHEEAVAELDDQGRPRLLTGTVQDITERKQAETAVIQARDEAERANAAKSVFLSRMSHELRTPLNAVLGFSQLLQTDPDQPLTEVQTDNVAEIRHAGKHLLEMVNEVLDLARIESGHMELSLEPVAVAAVVNACAAGIRPMADERGITLGFDVDPDYTVQADYTRLTQVLLNLLSNAVKYNRDDGRIEVRVTAAGPARLRIAVADSGHGIAAADQQRLFQPFERLESAYAGIEGTGIGLALSRYLVEAMGGTIGVDSSLGVGSEFWFELPAAEPAAAHGGESGEALCRRVLYVEDNPANLKLVQKSMAARGDIELLAATSAEEGLEIARQQRPALVLLDINLPGMDGLAAIARLREDPLTRHIPVVAVSSNAMPGDIRRAAAAGFDDYLTKPLDMRRLHAMVDQYLQRAEYPDSS